MKMMCWPQPSGMRGNTCANSFVLKELQAAYENFTVILCMFVPAQNKLCLSDNLKTTKADLRDKA